MYRKKSMSKIEFIKCHGSGNDFIMVDITNDVALQQVDWSAFSRVACDRVVGIGSDGVLLVVRHDDGVYGMDMLNPDGTHAEMCGNGIRCVARYAMERGYIGHSGVLRSGGRDYSVEAAGEVCDGIAAYAVTIPIRLWSRDFAFFDEGERWLGRCVGALSEELCFSALSLGNPHMVASVENISLGLLETLGERVKRLKDVVPNGVNISLYECRSRRSIFVATYERGAGITLSCGTAMTASATAAALLGEVECGERIEVRNRGGRVYCTTRVVDEDIFTRLEGNATFEWRGEVTITEDEVEYSVVEEYDEAEHWRAFVDELNR